ncbi:LysR substrate-binding domain-containing protein [Stutzerimonas kirkiae]|uniref:LysR family transcriptional regulator n=1 Tax=Stutzerimonas kirkiae TaxID=2211392 RepID=A0A4V2KDG7_9GAMM|nr:LysR substrate-binding domain-containing protein [Stutzerimonas kirkiae]TBU99297.1 LysR family transcriptional regulator [Stutzerimonas kirkiae]TBV05129.1 LysR family transcriptional regulator [Stutzerimonas kirkiae]TBV06243.1 LysR family transcriptional regulator [Stutzerimonas kirkiae]TBV11848.1 LysR family transcriptional regulator [Stutzerimonas kirkiae]
MSAWERLNPQLLRHFLAVSRCGSLTAAADQLHCVPSNVSARLRQLEGQLGVRLFQRQAQRLHLTPAGERLLPYAEQLDRLCQQAWHSVQDDLWSGTLRLGAMETCAAVRLPEVLATFHRDAPRVQLQLKTGTSGDMLAEVLAGRLDAALIGGPYQHPALRTEAIWPERLALVLAVGARVEQVLEYPVTLIGFPGGCHYQQRLERWSEERGLRVTARQSYGSLDAIFASIAAGMGIGMLPLFLRQSHPRGPLVAWQELPAELADAPTLLVRRQDAVQHPALEHLLELLRARRYANG